MNYSKIDLDKAPKYKEQLIKVWHHLKLKRKFQLLFFLIVILTSGIAEFFSLALVIPFLDVLSNPEKITSTQFGQYLKQVIGLSNPDHFLIALTVVFVLTAILSSLIKFINYWLSLNLSALIGSDLSFKVFQNIIHKPYEEHIKKNSSETISAITTQLPFAIQFLCNTLKGISNVIILLFIISTLIIINFKITFLVTIIFAFFYFLIAKFIRKKLLRNGILFERASQNHVKIIQESIGGMRDISLNRSQETFLKIYNDIDYPMRKYQFMNNVLSGFPKYFIESLSLVIIAILGLLLTNQQDEFLNIVPTLGILAFGAQKILPSIQELYRCWADQKSFAASLNTILLLINDPLNENKYQKDKKVPPFKFHKSISLKNVNFRYSHDTPYIINDLSLEIPKGQKIGIIGGTGSGKSTLVDLMMGLLKPNNGNISIDGMELKGNNSKILNAWRSSIANVPQNIFLSDRSFKENIAFGIPLDEINLNKVISASKKAKISNYIENTNFGYDTIIGERGLKLSGGQKQRIGIARALYRNAEIIIFDEATSSLDYLTEKKVMESINNLDQSLTIIIIAHRLSTIENCDRVIKIEKGQIIYDGSPKNI